MPRPSDDLDPDSGRDPAVVVAELEAIDEVLAGRAVEPRFAELAELSLLLLADRPRLEPDRARALDERVLAQRPSRRRPRVSLRPHLGLRAGSVTLVGCALAGLIALVIVGGGGGSSTSSSSSSSGVVRAVAHKPSAGSLASVHASAASASGSPSRATRYGSAGFGSSKAAGSVPAPLPNGRRIVASAQLALAATPARIDSVAQEVFDVVDAEKGIVKSSSVVTGSSASASPGATFSLSIPSANLTSTLTRLSSLRWADVASRTDGTQDVNNSYLADGRRLADARALRAALLRQLAGATSTGQIDSLQARIRDAEATITTNENALRSLNARIAFSSLSVQIEPATGATGGSGTSGHSGGFTLGRAGHDALRVLIVTAGVLLIALAVLLPIGLLVALGWRLTAYLRARRREGALDAA